MTKRIVAYEYTIHNRFLSEEQHTVKLLNFVVSKVAFILVNIKVLIIISDHNNYTVVRFLKCASFNRVNSNFWNCIKIIDLS